MREATQRHSILQKLINVMEKNKACGNRRRKIISGGWSGKVSYGRDVGAKDCMNCRRIFPDKEGAMS